MLDRRRFSLLALSAVLGAVALASCGGGSGSSSLPATRSDQASAVIAPQRLAAADAVIDLPQPQATSLPAVAYITADYTSDEGGEVNYTALTYAFNSSTNTLDAKALISLPGLPQASALSRDGAILYLSLATTSASKPSTVGTLEAFSVTPTSATALGKLTYAPSSQFALAYAGTTKGTGTEAYVYTDTPTAATLELYSPDLRTKIKAGPSITSPMDYVAPAPGSLNAYTVDKSGTYRVYNASGNDYILPLGGVSSALSPGIPVLAVTPTGKTVYALTVNRTGKGSSTIDVINPTNSTITNKIALSFPCYQIAVDAANANVYAIGEVISGETVTFPIAVISTTTKTVTKTFNVPDETIRITPWLAVSTDSKHLLLLASTGSGASSTAVDVVDPLTEKLVTSVPLPKGPVGQGIQGDQIWTEP